MDRPIIGFHTDREGHWVAELACGHGQHVRHDPPFTTRPWVLTAEGRAARMGAVLDCPRCDRLEMPDNHAPYRRTAAFTGETMPAALRQHHTTRAGVWALIHVQRGQLEYRLSTPFDSIQVLVPGSPGIVPPEVEHAVSPRGPVEFLVEFWRAQSQTGPAGFQRLRG
ncbi:MAG: DUF3565 domain-containing protein [Candidatus Binatia bacterium]